MRFNKDCFYAIVIFIIGPFVKSSLANTPEPEFIFSPPCRIEGYSGDSLRVSTRANGSLPLVYTWFKDALVVQSGDNTLFFPKLCEDNQGSYMCIASNEFGSDTSEFQIEVLQKLTANYAINPKAGPAPLKVNFYNRSKGTIRNVQWSFGDGKFSTQNNPIHTFKKPGTYYIKLTVSGERETDTSVMIRSINVTSTVLAKKTEHINDTIPEKDSLPHMNCIQFSRPLFFMGKYQGGDSIRIVFHNSNQSADSVIIWYGKGQEPDFSDTLHTIRIDPGFFYCESDTDSLVFTIRDSCFEHYRELINAALIFKKGKHVSDTVLSPVSFEIGHNDKKAAENTSIDVVDPFISQTLKREISEAQSASFEEFMDTINKAENTSFNTGSVFEILVSNESTHTDTVKHTINLSNSFSKDFTVETMDPYTSDPVDLIILEPLQTRRYLVVYGTDSFVNSIKETICSGETKIIEIEEFKDSINFCYFIPYTDEGRALLSISDRSGKCLWQYSLLELKSGINRFSWDCRGNDFTILPCGFYIFQITLFDHTGKNPKSVYRDFFKSDY